TASDFSGTLRSSETQVTSLLSLTVEGLLINATYYLRAGAVWTGTTFYALTNPVSTATFVRAPTVLATPFTGVGAYVLTGSWGADSNSPGTLYETVLSTRTPLILGLGDNVAVSTRPEASPAADFSPLQPNTTYHFFGRSVGRADMLTDFIALGSTSTLAVPPDNPRVVELFKSSIAVSWDAVSSRGYRVIASSTDFDGSGTVPSSTTLDGTLTSLVVTGLDVNTTYYLRVGSLNHNWVANYAVAGASSTLAEPVSSIRIYRVFNTSVTLNWASLPTGPPQTVTAEGYRVDASTASDFTGDILSSTTFTGVQPSTLTVTGLTGASTYYFRVGSLNWQSAPNFDFAGSTFTGTAPPRNPVIVAVFLSSITASWGGVDPDEGYVLDASTAPDFSGTLRSSGTQVTDLLTLTVENLGPNTTYYLRAGAVWTGTTVYAYTAPPSTSTLAADPLVATPAFSGITISTISGHWGQNGNPDGTLYETVVSTETPLVRTHTGNVTVSTAPQGSPVATFWPLEADTTYYLYARAYNNNGIATDFVALGSTSTLALPPGGPHITEVFNSSITVAWATVQSQGYRVIASSTDFDGSGLVYSSFTADGGLGSLSVSVAANTTYYIQVGALNHNSVANYAVDGASSTLSDRVSSIGFAEVFLTSVTVNWTPLPASPQTATAEGYLLHASTAADFSGTVHSSETRTGVQPSTLILTDMLAGTTYYFRVGSLNWVWTPNFEDGGSTITAITVPQDPRIDAVFHSS
ncbi:hypothetical protein ACFL2T_08015, partial [Elusimicrobiota bacterium]